MNGRGRGWVAPALVLAGLAVHAALGAGLFAALPVGVRLTLAFAVLILLPGAAFARLTGPPPGGAWLAPGWALGFGVAWQGLLVLATRAAHLPFTVLARGSLLATASLWLIVLWRTRAGSAPGVDAPAPADARPRWPLAARVAILLAAAVGAWHSARLGAPLGIATDSPDHVGTIRRMLGSGDAFPRDAFFRDFGGDPARDGGRDAGRAGADPRKGLWHSEVALIARLSGADPLATWRLLPAFIVPLFVFNVAVFGYLLRGPPAAAVAAWAYLLTYGGSLAEQYVREAGFATKLGDQLALATAAAVLADLARPSLRWRLAAVGLALGALAAHVYYVIPFALSFVALALGLAIADRALRPRVVRLAGTATAIGIAGLPYLAWRWSQSYAPSNVIHTDPQGLLWIFDGVRVVSIGVLWDWLGSLWVLVPLAAPWLWREGRQNPAVLYLLTTSLAVALVIFDPPVVAVLEPRLGYLLMRMVWMIPLAGFLGWALTGLARALALGPARGRAALAMAVVVALAAPALADGVNVLFRHGRVAYEEEVQRLPRWADALAWLDVHLPAGSTVLSDPATSYAIPMLTRHYVATLADQHSSPNDPLALTRILDARDALDPYAAWSRVREVVRRYRVDAIAINDRFAEPPGLDYWAPRHDWFVALRARLDSAPAAFERIDDRGDFVVYRVHAAALETLATRAPARPFVTPWSATACPPGRPIDRGLPALCGFRLARHDAAPGDTIRGEADWHAPAALRPGSYQVAVRFDRALPDGVRPPAFVAKPVRKVIERLRGERYRFRADHLPVGGAYGVDLWRPDQVVRDDFTLVVPPDVAAGRYTVRVRMLRQPHYPNFRLSDYFFDDDYYAGIPVATLEVRRRPADGGS